MPVRVLVRDLIHELLTSKQPVSAAKAEATVSAYLTSFRSLDAQTQALDELSAAVAYRASASPAALTLMDAIDRSWEGLSGHPAQTEVLAETLDKTG